MQISEIFLIVWACLATGLAVFLHHNLRKAMKGGVILCVMLEAIAQGKATVKTHGDGRITMEIDGNEITLKEIQ